MKPHKGKIENWTTLPSPEGLGHYIQGTFVDHPRFAGEEGHTSAVIAYLGNGEIETKNSRYTLIGPNINAGGAGEEGHNTIIPDNFDPVADITAFHEKFGLAYSGPPRELEEELVHFRLKFMAEELCEYVDMPTSDREIIQEDLTSTHKPGNLEQKFDALIDLVYVVLGTAHLHGFDFREGWRRVHAANMKKVRAQHAKDSTRGSTFDVIKPPGWKPADLSDLVQT